MVEYFCSVIGSGWRRDLVATYLVSPTVDRVQHRVGEIHARAEELHLLAKPHGRDATGNRVVVTPARAHQVVILVPQGWRCHGRSRCGNV